MAFADCGGIVHERVVGVVVVALVVVAPTRGVVAQFAHAADGGVEVCGSQRQRA